MPELGKTIAEDLQSKIQEGIYKFKLPTNKELVSVYSCSNRTVARAMEVLKARKIVHTVPGKGTFIVKKD